VFLASVVQVMQETGGMCYMSKLTLDGMWIGEQANAGGVNSVGIRLS
jgi:hypothetical protein